MQIGFVRENKMVVVQNDERKEVKYLEMFIKPALGVVASFTLSKNKSENSSAPAYNLYAHSEKGWISRKSKVGALWMKQTEEGETFMNGHIESPLFEGGRLQISVWKAKAMYEGEVIDWLYDVSWKHYETKNESNGNVPGTVVYPKGNDIEISEDEIPF